MPSNRIERHLIRIISTYSSCADGERGLCTGCGSRGSKDGDFICWCEDARTGDCDKGWCICNWNGTCRSDGCKLNCTGFHDNARDCWDCDSDSGSEPDRSCKSKCNRDGGHCSKDCAWRRSCSAEAALPASLQATVKSSCLASFLGATSETVSPLSITSLGVKLESIRGPPPKSPTKTQKAQTQGTPANVNSA